MARAGRARTGQLITQIVDVCRDVPILVSAPLYRMWHLQHWGATLSERSAELPGDEFFPHAQYPVDAGHHG